MKVHAALVALGFALAGAAGCARPQGPPSDSALIALFQAHRADFDSLRATGQAAIRFGPDNRDLVLTLRWNRITRRLGLTGGGALEDTGRIFIQAGARPLGRDSIDAKGFAWLDSIMPAGIVFDTLASLDARREPPGRYIRHLDGHWWLYRIIGERARD